MVRSVGMQVFKRWWMSAGPKNRSGRCSQMPRTIRHASVQNKRADEWNRGGEGKIGSIRVAVELRHHLIDGNRRYMSVSLRS